jgi:signal transduction histidine kinase
MTAPPLEMLAELRRVRAFADLDDDQLLWFLGRAKLQEYEPGEYIGRVGDEARFMMVILEGEFQAKAEGQGVDGPVFTMEAGRISGYLPFSRMKHFPLASRCTRKMRALLLDRDYFPEMYQAMPDLIPKLVGILTDRVRDSARQTTQYEKLAALGKLSAGLAHELNNPAAAARQAASTAKKLFACYQELLDDFATATVTPRHLQLIRGLEKRSEEQIAATAVLDSLERSDREEELGSWLESLKLEHSWKLAPVLADAGWTRQTLEASLAELPQDLVELALYRLVSAIEMQQALAQIYTSTARMSDLVSAMKDYSFMDRASMVEFDVNHSIETTLKMFGYRFKKGIELETRYDSNLPPICANGSQMNQVWTNLIDNALDAIEANTAKTAKGRFSVVTRREVDQAVIEMTDNGGGIPPEIGKRIFEPFFTTKSQGEGTGLGLDMVYRIVRQHHGDVRFVSQNGETTFTVRLPLTQPKSN